MSTTVGRSLADVGIDTIIVGMTRVIVSIHIADIIEIDIHTGVIKYPANNKLFHARVTTQGSLA